MSEVRALFRLLLAGTLVGTAPIASAQSTCRQRAPYLELSMEGEWPDGSRGGVVAELRSALSAQDFNLCLVEGGQRESVAMIRLEWIRDGLVRIEVHDAVTDKHVWRELDVSGFDETSRTLAIAIGADELVRASWAELMLEGAPEPATPPPPQVVAVVDRAVEHAAEERGITPASSFPVWLDAAVNLEHYTGGELHLGGSLSIEPWMHRNVGLRLGLGGRSGLRRSGDLGSVRARAVAGELDLVVGLWGEPKEGWQLVGMAGVFVGWLRFRSRPEPGVTGQDDSGVMAGAKAGVALRWSAGPARFFFEAGLGAPFNGVAALDGEERLSGAYGLQTHARVGIGVRR